MAFCDAAKYKNKALWDEICPGMEDFSHIR